jgi:hypothetical protein
MLRVARWTAGVGVGLFAADVVINDDFDSSVTNYFRARISPAEKALDPRPRICILGAGWGGLVSWLASPRCLRACGACARDEEAAALAVQPDAMCV